LYRQMCYVILDDRNNQVGCEIAWEVLLSLFNRKASHSGLVLNQLCICHILCCLFQQTWNIHHNSVISDSKRRKDRESLLRMNKISYQQDPLFVDFVNALVEVEE